MNLKSHLLRLLKLACLAAFIYPQARGEEEDIGKLLDQAIEREVAKLQPNSLKLPAPKDGIKPPPLIQSAGKEFVDAWQDWSVVKASPEQGDENKTDQPDPTQQINVYADSKPFIDFLKLCINANPPPNPAEFERFIYSPTDRGPFVCGDVYDGFNIISAQGRMLLLLRRGDYLQALRESTDHSYLHKEVLHKAFGVDPEKFEVGRWLDREINPEELCQKGSEFTARMMMDWIDFRWSEELKRHQKAILTKQQESYDEPRISYHWLTGFLRPDSGVRDETKARIIEFIGTRGLEMISLADWLNCCRKGSEKWFVSLAKAGLHHPLNQTRKASSRILTVTGIEHQEPSITPDPRFRVFINGKSWAEAFNALPGNDQGLSLAFELENGKCEIVRLSFQRPDTFTVDADEFLKRDPGAKLSMVTLPVLSGRDGYSANQPWLCAAVPLPLDFVNIIEVNIQTFEFTIRPKLPRRNIELLDGIYQVEFGRTDADSGWLTANSGGALVLPQISPGQYFVRICHPGAALGPKQRVTISKSDSLYEPPLQAASSLVIPVEWTEAREPEKLPFELSHLIVGSRADLHESLRSLMKLKRGDGGTVTDFGRTPVTTNWRFPDSAIFPYMPPGEYEIESPDRVIEPKDQQPGCVIRKTSMKVEIRNDSPVFVVTKPLKIDYTRKD